MKFNAILESHVQEGNMRCVWRWRAVSEVNREWTKVVKPRRIVDGRVNLNKKIIFQSLIYMNFLFQLQEASNGRFDAVPNSCELSITGWSQVTRTNTHEVLTILFSYLFFGVKTNYILKRLGNMLLVWTSKLVDNTTFEILLAVGCCVSTVNACHPFVLSTGLVGLICPHVSFV